MKTQLIRLVDVFVLGPFMIYAASQSLLTRNEKTTLAAIGVATILYNLVNYLNERERDST